MAHNTFAVDSYLQPPHTFHRHLSADASMVQQAFGVLQHSSSTVECANANRFLEQFQSATTTGTTGSSSSLHACFELLEKEHVPLDAKIFAGTLLRKKIQAHLGTSSSRTSDDALEQLKNGVIGILRHLPQYAADTALHIQEDSALRRSRQQLNTLRRQLCLCLADLCLLSEQCLTYLNEIVQTFAALPAAVPDVASNMSSLILVDSFTMLLEELDNDKLDFPTQRRHDLLSVTTRVLDVLDSLAPSPKQSFTANDDYKLDADKLFISIQGCFEKWINDAATAGLLDKNRVATSTVFQMAIQCMQKPGILPNQPGARSTSLAVARAAVDLLATVSNIFMDTHGIQSEQQVAVQYQHAILHLEPLFDQLMVLTVPAGSASGDYAAKNNDVIHDFIACYVRLFVDAACGVVDELVDAYALDGSSASLGNAQTLSVILKCMTHVPSYRYWTDFLYQLSEQLTESMQADVIPERMLVVWVEWYVRFVDTLADDIRIDSQALGGEVFNCILDGSSSARDKNDEDGDDDDDDDNDDEKYDAGKTNKNKRRTTTAGVPVEDIIGLRREMPSIMKVFVEAMPAHTLAERILFHKMQMSDWTSVEACLSVAASLMPRLRRKYITASYVQLIDACIGLHATAAVEPTEMPSSSTNTTISAQQQQQPMALRLSAVRFLGKCSNMFTWRTATHRGVDDSAVEFFSVYSEERFGRLISSLLAALKRSPKQLGYAACNALLQYSNACPVEFSVYRPQCIEIIFCFKRHDLPTTGAEFPPIKAVGLLTEAVIRSTNALPNLAERFEFIEFLTSAAAGHLASVIDVAQQQPQYQITDRDREVVRNALDVIAISMKEWRWKLTSTQKFDAVTGDAEPTDIHSAAQLLLSGTSGSAAGSLSVVDNNKPAQRHHRRMQTPPSTPTPPSDASDIIAETPQQQLMRLKQERYAPLIERLMQTVANTCTQFIARESIVEKCVRCMRHMIRSLGREAAPMVPELMRMIVQLYAVKRYSCFLYLASIVIDEFGSFEACQEALLQLTHQLCSMTSVDTFGLHAVVGTMNINNMPSNSIVCPSPFAVTNSDVGIRDAFSERVDIIEDYFRLCQRWMQRCGHIFFIEQSGRQQQPGVTCTSTLADHLMLQMMLAAMLALLHQTQAQALQSVCDFLRTLSDLLEQQKRAGALVEKFEAKGYPQQLLATILIACINNSHFQAAGESVEDLAGVMWTQRLVYGEAKFCKTFLAGYAVKELMVQCGGLSANDEQEICLLVEKAMGAPADRVSGDGARHGGNHGADELLSLADFCMRVEGAQDHARQLYNALKSLMRAYRSKTRRRSTA